MKKIIIFASGSGSNAEKIIKHFNETDFAQVVVVFSNKPQAGVLEKAAALKTPSLVFNKQDFDNGVVLHEINKIKPDLIVLAGFLLKFPENIIAQYPNKIINIHPALLPKYGGKGMYGMHVHQAVFDNKETETGITIHYVNEHYDEGTIIFQAAVNIQNCITPEQIAQKVHELEYQYFSNTIQKLLVK